MAVALGPRSLVVEFAGLPASGKTVLYRRVQQAMQAQDLLAGPALAVKGAGLRRKAGLAGLYARFLLAKPHYCLAAGGVILRSRQVSFYDLTVALGAWLGAALAIFQMKRTPGLHLLDQGILQALWQVGLGAGRSSPERVFAPLRPFLELPDLLVLVEASPATIQHRMAGRTSPGRVDNDPILVEKAVALYFQMKAIVLQFSSAGRALPTLVVENDADGGLEEKTAGITRWILEQSNLMDVSDDQD